MMPNARRVYRESVLWHGTSMQSKIDLRNKGFDVSRKTDGATEGASTSYSAPTEELIRNARRHNYLTAYDVSARNYARRANPENPALVRTIGVKSNLNIELDPDSKDENGEVFGFNCRTTDSIPKKYIIGSKSSQPGADAKVFRKELSNAGFEVSTSRAGELLRAVQSDSEDDF
ncbi:type III effector [Pseudomonas syringae]|uniref:type III effector n=2 Tax=Pseudomonas TaxID=286 RepID=UPI001EFBE4AF|nr:type III effector [Pseudomonas syringae]